MKKKIRAVVIGYGNIGKYVIEALEATVDFEVAGVVRRAASVAAATPPEIAQYKIVDSVEALGNIDVAIICAPSRKTEKTAAGILAQGINTVDSFDIHPEIAGLRKRLGRIACENNVVAIVAAGWDPGTDSVVRALIEACVPAGVTHTNFGPGMSMGHTVAAKAVEGVKNALSMTIPAGGGVHRREVYIETEPDADFEAVAAAINTDSYFAEDETKVTLVPDVAALVDMTHGVSIVRDGASGRTDGQHLEFSMRIHNPALTAQILVSAARAAVRMQARAKVVKQEAAPEVSTATGGPKNPGGFGAYTLIEIAPIDLLPGEREDIIRNWNLV